MTVPQTKLLEALGPEWISESVVSLGPVENGHPTHYKIDLAHLGLKIAVEVDGETHKTKVGRERDARKDRKLSGLGWTVLRFSNREVLKSASDCALEVSSTISMLKGRRPI